MIETNDIMVGEQREEFLHDEARNFMDQFGMEAMSLDEMIAEHNANPFMSKEQIEHADYLMHMFYKL